MWVIKVGLFLLLFVAIGSTISANTGAEHGKMAVSSPDGGLSFVFRLTAGGPVYDVSYKGTRLIGSSPLSLSFAHTGDFGKEVTAGKPVMSKGEDDYTLAVGKTSAVHDRYNEMDLPLEERAGAHRRVHLVVRMFNDGIAFRYIYMTPADSLLLTAENSCFRLLGDPMITASLLPGYTTSHENRYTNAPFSVTKSDTLMDMPVFVEFPDSIYMAITEAALVDYAGMYLVKQGDLLISRLSPLPDNEEMKVRAVLPHASPWRVLLISRRAGALMESNIITSLNEPCAVHDLSWLRPGKTDFHWWNGDIVPDTTFPPGINFETNKYYIDFCARNKLEYHSVIGYAERAWYKNDGIGYMPGPHTDVTEPVPGLDMQEICDYAKSKGVGIRVWVHWKALYAQLDKAFAQFEKWGISGMMVDFMDRDDQEMVNIQTEILQKAALHHLHIQFHGAYKPTGLSRTYPNEFTREGTLNYENDKWGNPITPDDDINIPFTRLIAGATDYHLGGFRAVPASRYTIQYTRPVVLGTRCHMLAMYVILESALGMVCDFPAAYEGQIGFEFLKEVPTTWDETKAPLAEPRQFVMIARRKGTDWFVGGITNGEARTRNLSLDFLPPGEYEATIYRDAEDATNDPNHLVVETRSVRPEDHLTIQAAPGGGFVMKIRRTGR
jgi:alpha-glucosidase